MSDMPPYLKVAFEAVEQVLAVMRKTISDDVAADLAAVIATQTSPIWSCLPNASPEGPFSGIRFADGMSVAIVDRKHIIAAAEHHPGVQSWRWALEAPVAGMTDVLVLGEQLVGLVRVPVRSAPSWGVRAPMSLAPQRGQA